MQTVQETILNVTEIEPKLKHPTIFQIFDNLEAGESMVIHNDHDPKPVYYQLLGERGDIFTWQYLEQGPQWWKVRIAKKGEKAYQQTENKTEPVQSAVAKEAGKETIINVTEIEPKLKHPTIFQVFDGLEGGESLVIHNDHDPKPVYYQLLGERGDIFTWQYLQQGPQWWDVRITKRGAEDKETVGQIAAKDLRKAEVFKKYGIDFCCGGKKTVREICKEKGIDATKIEQELQQSNQLATSSTNAYNDWGLDFLADFIVNNHHNYVRKSLPELRGYALKVAQVHGAHHPELSDIQKLVEQVNEELSEHMIEEENSLFSYVKKIVQAKNNNQPLQKDENKTLSSLIENLEKEHDSVGRAMEEIRSKSHDFAIPEDACASYKLFYKMLEDFENDLHIHIHLENNILFPKAVEMEKNL